MTVYTGETIRPLRLGIVPYLNVLPLLEGLDGDFPRENWHRGTPRDLSAMLALGELDVAIISVFEGFRRPGVYTVVPDAAIGCDGPVTSVVLFSRVPPGEIRSILLDRASLSSTHLLRIIAAQHLGIDPAFEVSEKSFERDSDWTNSGFDAALAIGDTALGWRGRCPHEVDLGEAWKAFTGLPFVFAVWFVREGLALTSRECAAFSRARQRGMACVPEIVARLPADVIDRHGGRQFLENYLTTSIRFELGERQLAAADLYRRKLIELNLVAADAAPLRVIDSAEAKP